MDYCYTCFKDYKAIYNTITPKVISLQRHINITYKATHHTTPYHHTSINLVVTLSLASLGLRIFSGQRDLD